MQPEIGEKVRVYWNLRLHCFSVQTYRPDLGGWRLYYWCDNLALKQCQLKVSQAGRERCLREKRKNVHAYVQGIVTEIPSFKEDWTLIKYNPYECGSFTRHGIPIHGAYHLYLERGSIYLVS